MVVINISMYCLLCILMSYDMVYLEFSISSLCRAYITGAWNEDCILAISVVGVEQYVN
jgi:hypothetical protein